MKYTSNYGAIKVINDNRTSYLLKDTTGIEFMFEVYPMNFTEEDLNNVISNTHAPIWFIRYVTSIIEVEEKDIEYALKNGFIIKLSITGYVIDNYGFIHNISFDKKTESYKININNVGIRVIKENNTNAIPLSDVLITALKESDNPKLLAGALHNQNKMLMSLIYKEFDRYSEKLNILEDKIRQLEQK